MPFKPSAVIVICLTVVAVCIIVATTLLLITTDKSQLPEGWLALFFATMAGVVPSLITMLQGRQTARQVDDLYNGRGDAKTRAAVADVIRDEHLDPAAAEQIAADRVRRDEH